MVEVGVVYGEQLLVVVVKVRVGVDKRNVIESLYMYKEVKDSRLLYSEERELLVEIIGARDLIRAEIREEDRIKVKMKIDVSRARVRRQNWHGESEAELQLAVVELIKKGKDSVDKNPGIHRKGRVVHVSRSYQKEPLEVVEEPWVVVKNREAEVD